MSGTLTSTGTYIYAFLPASSTGRLDTNSLRGLDGQSVQIIVADDLAAVVSPTELKKIRPQRKNLAAHQEVVTYLARHHDMLPVAFGLVADDSVQVKRLMRSHGPLLREQIERVAGHLEMAVQLQWAVPNIFQYFVERDAVLLASRDLVISGQATRDQQIAMGQHFEMLINQQRQQHTDTFIPVIQPWCKEIDIQAARDERDCFRGACLIARDAEAAFVAAVHQAASKFSDEFAVSFNGPWPPYSFVKLALELE